MSANKTKHLRGLPTNHSAPARDPRGLDRLLDSPRSDAIARRLPAIAATVTLALLGTYVGKSMVDGSGGPSTPSVADLQKMPYKEVTPGQTEANQGASALGEQVDGWVYEGPNSSTATTNALNEEIAGQDPAGFIHEGETFKVPYMPPPGTKNPNILPPGVHPGDK